MSADRFLDTNDLVYLFDETAPGSPRRGRGEDAREMRRRRFATSVRGGSWLRTRALDAAVAAAHGWLVDLFNDDVLRESLALSGSGRGARGGVAVRG